MEARKTTEADSDRENIPGQQRRAEENQWFNSVVRSIRKEEYQPAEINRGIGHPSWVTSPTPASRSQRPPLTTRSSNP